MRKNGDRRRFGPGTGQFHQITFDEYAAAPIPTPYNDFIKAAPTVEIQSAFVKHYPKFRGYQDGDSGQFRKIMVSISGGADSDRLLDLIERIGYPPGAVTYVYFNTGMEYRATIRHIEALERQYGVTIKKKNAACPVPVAVKKYGYPFLSKQISQYIYRLQKHGFTWEDSDFQTLYAKYPKCKAALRWWCNEWGENSKMNINNRKWLREFMIENPPQFPISNLCCDKAKKDTAHAIAQELQPDLEVTGVRKAEGGARSTAYRSCFDNVDFGISKLRPLFWFKSTDCADYDKTFDIEHSDCYTKYGLDRTGCACCVYGKYFEKELEAARLYEPHLYALALRTFGPSYEYTRQYIAYRDRRNAEG